MEQIRSVELLLCLTLWLGANTSLIWRRGPKAFSRKLPNNTHLTGPRLFGNQVATINPSFIKYPWTRCRAVFSATSISTRSPSCNRYRVGTSVTWEQPSTFSRRSNNFLRPSSNSKRLHKYIWNQVHICLTLGKTWKSRGCINPQKTDKLHSGKRYYLWALVFSSFGLSAFSDLVTSSSPLSSLNAVWKKIRTNSTKIRVVIEFNKIKADDNAAGSKFDFETIEGYLPYHQAH